MPNSATSSGPSVAKIAVPVVAILLALAIIAVVASSMTTSSGAAPTEVKHMKPSVRGRHAAPANP
jgi:hypothetical protein